MAPKKDLGVCWMIKSSIRLAGVIGRALRIDDLIIQQKPKSFFGAISKRHQPHFLLLAIDKNTSPWLGSGGLVVPRDEPMPQAQHHEVENETGRQHDQDVDEHGRGLEEA